MKENRLRTWSKQGRKTRKNIGQEQTEEKRENCKNEDRTCEDEKMKNWPEKKWRKENRRKVKKDEELDDKRDLASAGSLSA